MSLQAMPIDLLLLKYHDMNTGPVEKIEIGQELKRGGKYPKADPWEVPKFTPRYGSG